MHLFAVADGFASAGHSAVFFDLMFCPPPDTICKGDTVALSASNPLALSYSWTPAYNISSTTVSNPLVYPDTTTTYVVNISGITNNLIFNGNFSLGNLGFTSAYTYTNNLWPEATYYVGPNPNLYHSGFAACGDHTTGTGNMMIINGAGTPNTNIWQQTIPVVPNSNYVFSCWLTSVHSSSPAQLQFFVNNVQIGPVFTASPVTCQWNMFFDTWSSGTSTSAIISIRNQNTSLSGNDFAIDDIYFAQVVSIYDSTLIVVEDPVINLGNDTSICSQDTIILTPGPGYAQYQWSNSMISPSISVSSPGLYWVEVETDRGCKASDSITIGLFAAPAISITGDSVCIGDTAVLTAASVPGAQFQWSNGAASSSVTVAPAGTTTYSVVVTDPLGCKDSADAVAFIHPLPQVSISADALICSGTPVTLNASGGLHYLWSPTGSATSAITVAPTNPSTTYSVLVTDINGCSDSASVTVSTLPYPEIALWQETDTLCKGKSAGITASGGDLYLWSTGEATPAITISPLQNSSYSVTVSNTSGGVVCSNDTALMQNVKSCNVIYFPNAISLSGINNIFKPVGEDIYSEEYHLAIYNRWGQLLFRTTDFEEGWDGTYKGVNVAEGVYVYEVIIDGGYGKPFLKQGTVTVVR